jgi:hypothetical protein
VLGVEERELGQDLGAEVASVRDEAFVAEPAHQLDERSRRRSRRHSRLRGAIREAVARQRRDHDVVRRARDPVRLGIGEQRQERELLDEGARPAVDEQDRESRTARRPLVHEVDPEPADVRLEVRQRVELALVRSPVEAVGPVRHQRSQRLALRSLLPSGVVHLIGPAGVAQPPSQVGEHRVLDADRERSRGNLHTHAPTVPATEHRVPERLTRSSTSSSRSCPRSSPPTSRRRGARRGR